MDKYKVILVDDEEEVIDVIERKIHWDMLGFDVVGSANNGVKALELVEKLQPDVVITDIKMPYMDGLELSRRLNNDYQNIHIIIFTGFDEFEYAKEAVHLEIEEYMLKPINALELSDCLKEGQELSGQGEGGKAECREACKLFQCISACSSDKSVCISDRGQSERVGL